MGGDGPSRSEVRVARLKAEVDLSPQALLPLPIETEEVELIRCTRKGGRFHRCSSFNDDELARMVGHRHHMMLRELVAEIAKQFELSDREQVDLIG